MLAFPILAQENLGARPMGMGGAFAGLADDVNAIFINPAGISSIKKESALVSTRVGQGREHTMIGGVEITPFGNLGIGYVGSTDPVEGFNLSAWDGETPTKYTTQTIYVTAAKDLNREIGASIGLEKISVGANLKFSSRKLGAANGLARDSGSGVDIDLASIFMPNNDLSLGMSMQNLLNGNKNAVLTGASGKLFNKNVTWVLDGDEIGCEWEAIKGLSVRAGRASYGLGVSVNGFAVDYACMNKTGPVHYWSISIAQQGST